MCVPLHAASIVGLRPYMKNRRLRRRVTFFDLRGYILIFFMMGLGISLKLIPGIPSEFFAGFYPGLGAALSIAGIRYLASWWKALKAEARKCDGKHL